MKFDAALLAGGRSTRMESDKALLDWHGTPLWKAQAQKLASLQPQRLFIASRAEQNLEASCEIDDTKTGMIFVNDPSEESSGPLGAITRCLRLATAPLLVLGIDMPMMSVDFLRGRMLARSSAQRGVVFRGANGFESLAAVYAQVALPFFEAALAARRLALQPLIADLVHAGLSEAVELQGEDEARFANANTPDEAARLLRFAI